MTRVEETSEDGVTLRIIGEDGVVSERVDRQRVKDDTINSFKTAYDSIDDSDAKEAVRQLALIVTGLDPEGEM